MAAGGPEPLPPAGQVLPGDRLVIGDLPGKPPRRLKDLLPEYEITQ